MSLTSLQPTALAAEHFEKDRARFTTRSVRSEQLVSLGIQQRLRVEGSGR